MSSQAFNKYLTEPEEKQLIKTIKKYGDVYAQRDLNWILLLRNTGIRVTPLSKLTFEDATKALADGHLVIRPETNKRGNGHTVFLNKPATKALKNLLKIREEMAYIAACNFYYKAGPFLIMSRNRKFMSVRSFQDRLKAWSTLAGVRCTPHTLRHTFGKRIIQNSTSPQALQICQAALGHKNIQSTTIYTEPDKEQLELSIEEAGS